MCETRAASYLCYLFLRLLLLPFPRYAVIDRIITHWDGPIGKRGHNVWLWRDGATRKFQLLPSGVDQTFEAEPAGKDWYGNRILKACFQSTTCNAEYDAEYASAMATFKAKAGELEQLALLARSQLGAANDFCDNPKGRTDIGCCRGWEQCDVHHVIEAIKKA